MYACFSLFATKSLMHAHIHKKSTREWGSQDWIDLSNPNTTWVVVDDDDDDEGNKVKKMKGYPKEGMGVRTLSYGPVFFFFFLPYYSTQVTHPLWKSWRVQPCCILLPFTATFVGTHNVGSMVVILLLLLLLLYIKTTMGTFGGIRWNWTTTSEGLLEPTPYLSIYLSSNFNPFLFEKNVKSVAWSDLDGIVLQLQLESFTNLLWWHL